MKHDKTPFIRVLSDERGSLHNIWVFFCFQTLFYLKSSQAFSAILLPYTIKLSL